MSGFRITPRPDARPLVEWSSTGPSRDNQVIVIGSPKGGSGKTSVTLFCATTLAEMGAKVLLIEATEGQAPLSQAFYPQLSGQEEEAGLGPHLYRASGAINPSHGYLESYRRLQAVMAREAPLALASLRQVRVTPEDDTRAMDFLPAGQGALSVLQSQPAMHQWGPRRALLRSFLDALVAAHPQGGWDFIFVDTLPTAESTVTKASLGVADSYALVVDVESSHPLTGFQGILQEIYHSVEARKEEGLPPSVFKGLVLNKVAGSGRRPLVERINRSLIAARQREAEARGFPIDILREIPRLMTLTLLGFNHLAVQSLSRRYPNGRFPDDLDLLTDEDVDAILNFAVGLGVDGEDIPAAAGVAWVKQSLKPLKARLTQEAESLAPLILSFDSSGTALGAYLEALPDTEDQPEGAIHE